MTPTSAVKTLLSTSGAFLLAAIMVTNAVSQTVATSDPKSLSPAADAAKAAKVSDLAFLSGRWQGTVDNNMIEQQCVVTDPAMMLCMFWMTDAKGTQMIEIYTLRDTSSGIEERVRFMNPELREEANDKGLTMKLASYTPRQLIFENASGGTYPKRSTLTRVGEDRFTSRIELIDAKGQASQIQAEWRKVQ